MSRQRALTLASAGASRAEIARLLGLSKTTVAYYLNSDARITNTLTKINTRSVRAGYAPVRATVAEVRAKYDRQRGCCAICGEPELAEGRCLTIDHDHRTGRFRGLLCLVCNSKLSIFDRDPVRLREYLDPEPDNV